jgi:putative endopeptidase
MDKKEAARDLALAVFPESTSIYYGENHFGDEAREDVENMAKSIIAVYKDRISKNDWLGDATKEKAIKKLDNMGLNVGYQDKASDLEGELTVDENLTFFENSENISEYSLKYEYEHFSEPIDKSQWAMPSYEVNAYYNPMDNSINFPAAILEEPFYSKDQSEEANYGGIATVIGHEITHAFDDNGALFDEKGNMKNWWTDEDTKAFKERTSAMVDLFDGREIFGGKVNGKLTVTENTADAGGISASLEALKKEKEDADTKAFFETYATIWREKSSTMFGQLMLTLDPHSPTELRTNVQVANMDEFYDVYDVKEGNPMYIAPEDRVHIW